MAKIPFTIRRGARYHFRRWLCLPNLIDAIDTNGSDAARATLSATGEP